jgi:hypothetical protein
VGYRDSGCTCGTAGTQWARRYSALCSYLPFALVVRVACECALRKRLQRRAPIYIAARREPTPRRARLQAQTCTHNTNAIVPQWRDSGRSMIHLHCAAARTKPNGRGCNRCVCVLVCARGCVHACARVHAYVYVRVCVRRVGAERGRGGRSRCRDSTHRTCTCKIDPKSVRATCTCAAAPFEVLDGYSSGTQGYAADT